MTKRRFGQRITFIGDGAIKSVNPWDMDSDKGWKSLSGDEEQTDEATYFQSVPWLYRAVKDRANNVSHMPYKINRNGEEYDYQDDPANDLAWMNGITTIWHKVEMALALTGRAYVKLDVNPSGYIKKVRYLVPTSITEHYDAQGVVDWYDHTVKGIRYPIKPTEIVAIYDPDWITESGPGKSSAAKAALTSAGVLYHTDIFIAKYFQHGAVKATILTTLGFTEDEAKRLKTWWDSMVSGVGNWWRAAVLKGEKVNPVIVGEGLDSLQNETLTTERRQNIATAMGVPESRMWSAAANYATRVQDDKAYFQGTIIPDCELIEEAFNEQLFTAEHQLDGYELAFQPETLDIFQTEAAEQASALQALVNAGIPLLMACDLVGLDIDAEQRAELEEMAKEPEPVPPQLVDVTAGAQAQLPANVPVQSEQAGNPDQANALAMWQRKAIKRWKESGSAVCEFVSDDIPSEIVETIASFLPGCASIDDIKIAFAMRKDEPIDVTDQLKRALDWLEANA